MLTEFDRRRLDQQGYLVIPGLMPPEQLVALRRRVDELFLEEGPNAGGEFKQEPGARRLANLVNKGHIFEEIILTPRVLDCMAHVLGPRFKLSSVNVRSTNPHSDADQPLHADSGAIASPAPIPTRNRPGMTTHQPDPVLITLCASAPAAMTSSPLPISSRGDAVCSTRPIARD